MEAMKNGPLGSRRISIAADLFWFAVASVLAGLCAAITVAAMAMLLAQPARADSGTGLAGVPAAAVETGDRESCGLALLADEPGLPLLDDCRHALLLVLGREEELDRLGLECETGVEGGVHPTEHGFLRLLDRERREIRDLLRHVDRTLLDAGVGDELTDEAHVIRLAGAHDVAGQDVAHCLVFADRAREALRAAAARNDAELHIRLTELR